MTTINKKETHFTDFVKDNNTQSSWYHILTNIAAVYINSEYKNIEEFDERISQIKE